MSGCECSEVRFDGASRAYKRALLAVIAINATMFLVEISAGYMAQSQALKADALDFAGDTATYAISLAVIGASLYVRATAALLKGASLGLMALFVLGSTTMTAFSGAAPKAPVMGGIGMLALIANLLSVAILYRWRDGDSNIRSVWLCSRNDAIGNVAVIGAGAAVWVTGTYWPDLIVAALLAALFTRSAISIVIQAVEERRSATALPAA